MKRFLLSIMLLAMAAFFVGCANETDVPKLLDKDGIAPYEFSASEKYVLQSFGMEGNSQMISFKAPPEAVTLNVNVYRLEDSKVWSSIGGGGISIGTDQKPAEKLTGTFTMQLKENYVLDFIINTSGRASYKTDEILLNGDMLSSTKGFLREFQAIELNKEIPVALMVYDSGLKMESLSLQDYFEPSTFDGMDLVQAVTLSFSDQ